MSKPSLERVACRRQAERRHTCDPRKMRRVGAATGGSGAGHQQVRPWAQAYSPLRPGLRLYFLVAVCE